MIGVRLGLTRHIISTSFSCIDAHQELQFVGSIALGNPARSTYVCKFDVVPVVFVTIAKAGCGNGAEFRSSIRAVKSNTVFSQDGASLGTQSTATETLMKELD